MAFSFFSWNGLILLAAFMAVIGAGFRFFWSGASIKKLFFMGLGFFLGGILGGIFLEKGSYGLGPLKALAERGAPDLNPFIVQMNNGFHSAAGIFIIVGLLAMGLCAIFFLRGLRRQSRPGADQPSVFSISGRVQTGGLGTGFRPVPANHNPRITLVGTNEVINPDRHGFYQIPNLSGGRYDIICEADGYERQERELWLGWRGFIPRITGWLPLPGWLGTGHRPTLGVRGGSRWNFVRNIFSRNPRENFTLAPHDVTITIRPERQHAPTNETIRCIVRVEQGNRAMPNTTINVDAADGGTHAQINGENAPQQITTGGNGEATIEVGYNATAAVTIQGDLDIGHATCRPVVVNFIDPVTGFGVTCVSNTNVDEGEGIDIAVSTSQDIADNQQVQARVRFGNRTVMDWFNLNRVNNRTFDHDPIDTTNWAIGDYRIEARATWARRTATGHSDTTVEAVAPEITDIRPVQITDAINIGDTSDIVIRGRHMVGVSIVRFEHASGNFEFSGRLLQQPTNANPNQCTVRFAARDSRGNPSRGTIPGGRFNVILVRPPGGADNESHPEPFDYNPPNGVLRVIVTQNRQPVDGMTVQWGPHTVTASGSAGVYQVAVPFDQTRTPHDLCITDPNTPPRYNAKTVHNVVVQPTATPTDQRVELELSDRAGGINVVVRSPDRGNLDDANVYYESQAGNSIVATNEGGGRYRINVGVGDLGDGTLHWDHNDYDAKHHEFTVTAGRFRFEYLELTPRVITPPIIPPITPPGGGGSGGPGKVKIGGSKSKIESGAFTVAEGAFKFDFHGPGGGAYPPPPPIHFDIDPDKFTAPLLKLGEKILEKLDGDKPIPPMPKSGRITGRVIDQDNKPVIGATIIWGKIVTGTTSHGTFFYGCC